MMTSPRRPTLLEAGFSAAMCFAFASGLTLWVLWRCRIGIDLTDEGFYLQWLAHPWQYPTSISQFGFFYRPLYLVTGGDLVVLRVANQLLTVTLATVFTWTVLGERTRQWGYWTRGAASLAFGATALVQLNLWLPTPNYNSLALQGLLIAGTGVASLTRFGGPQPVWHWLVLAAGGWIVFLAKPTSAAALALLSLVSLGLAGRFQWRGIALSLGAVLVLALGTALVIDGSPNAFLQRLRLGLEDAQTLTPVYSTWHVFRLNAVTLTSTEKLWMTGAVVATLLACVIACSRWGSLSVLITGLLGMAAVIHVASTGGLPPGNARRGLLILAPLIGILPVFAWHAWAGRITLAASSKARLVWLMFAPWAFAFGTGSDYWRAAAMGGVFWAVAAAEITGALALTAAMGARLLMTIALTALFVTCILLGTSMNQPYRQAAPLAKQESIVQLPQRDLKLRTDADTAAYLREFSTEAQASGMRSGDLMVDLTGAYPGVSYLLGARNLGQAWLLGGYPGTTDFARRALQRVPCDAIGRAWVLVQSSGKRALDPKILLAHGADVDRDYTLAAQVAPPEHLNTHAQSHALLKPARPSATARMACDSARLTTSWK